MRYLLCIFLFTTLAADLFSQTRTTPYACTNRVRKIVYQAPATTRFVQYHEIERNRGVIKLFIGTLGTRRIFYDLYSITYFDWDGRIKTANLTPTPNGQGYQWRVRYAGTTRFQPCIWYREYAPRQPLGYVTRVAYPSGGPSGITFDVCHGAYTATVTRYGTACAGKSKTPTMVVSGSGLRWGTAFNLTLVPENQPLTPRPTGALLVVGATRASIPLPGTGGQCNLQVLPLLYQPVSITPNGDASYTILKSRTRDLSFLNTRWYFQYARLQPGVNAFGLVVSQPIEALFGD